MTPTRLSDEVASRLRTYIDEHQLMVGDRLPSERELAGMLSTSRATISQALRILSITGLIEVRAGSGAYVRARSASAPGTAFLLAQEPNRTSGPELADMLHWVERSLVEGPRPPEFDSTAIESAFSRLEEAPSSVGEFIEADAQFHLAVMRATRNRYLVALFEEVHRRIHQITYAGWVRSGESPAWLEPTNFTPQLDLHRKIRDAARSGDVDALSDALDAHHRAVTSHLP